jgi:hypothetical protein
MVWMNKKNIFPFYKLRTYAFASDEWRCGVDTCRLLSTRHKKESFLCHDISDASESSLQASNAQVLKLLQCYNISKYCNGDVPVNFFGQLIFVVLRSLYL